MFTIGPLSCAAWPALRLFSGDKQHTEENVLSKPGFRLCAALSLSLSLCTAAAAAPKTFANPLPLRLADGSLAESCADPSVLRDRTTDNPVWYLYCTTDPISHKERDGAGWRFRLMPIFRSVDLVHWYHVGDAFEERPRGLAAPTAGLWAPEAVYMNCS